MLSSVSATSLGRGTEMSDTQVLLERIATLRKRLDRSVGSAEVPVKLADAVRQAEAGAAHDDVVDATVSTATVEARPVTPPRQLTARARRVLERGRELLIQLRNLSEYFPFETDEEPPVDSAVFERTHPLATFYRETAAMTDASLRMVATFPDTATAQMQLCEGVESILGVVGRRTGTLASARSGVQRYACAV